MNQMPGQRASVQGHGNVVVQLVGDGNALNWQPDKPSLWLTTYDSPLLSEIQIKLPQDGLRAGYTATGKEEAGILSPFTRSLTLIGRDAELHALGAWLEGPDPISVQVVVGGGGQGKTRLALEFCHEIKNDWLAGFITHDEMVRFRDQQAIAVWNWCRPMLAVVDYAAAKAELIHSWLRDLVTHPAWRDKNHPKLRLLLLERHGDTSSAWWRTAFGDGGEIEMQSITAY